MYCTKNICLIIPLFGVFCHTSPWSILQGGWEESIYLQWFLYPTIPVLQMLQIVSAEIFRGGGSINCNGRSSDADK